MTASTAFTIRDFVPGVMSVEIAGAASRLLEEAFESFDRDLTAARSCVEKAAALLRSGQEKTAAPQRNGLATWQLRRTLQHIEENLENPIPVDELAAITRLSRGYFSAALKRSVGLSPHNFIIGRRIERAKEMMLETDESLSQIAQACGCSDQAHLSRLFRRMTGESPNSWRRARRVEPVSTVAEAGVR